MEKVEVEAPLQVLYPIDKKELLQRQTIVGKEEWFSLLNHIQSPLMKLHIL